MAPFDLIATDLDGTFLTDEKLIHPLNAHAVRTAAARGIATVFATGRPARWLDLLADIKDVHSWTITSNGAVTLDLASGEVTKVRPLSAETALAVVEEVRDVLPNVVCALEYVTCWGAETSFGLRSDVERPHYIGELAELLSREPVIKLILLDPSTATDELAEIVAPIVGDRLTVTYSFVAATGMLELSAPGVSKALALRELLAELGVAPERLVAFGDMPNDLAMLDLAGHGYAMAGAHPSLLGAGYQIAGDCNDAGVGRTLLRLLGEPAE